MKKYLSIATIALTLFVGFQSEARAKSSAKREEAKQTCLAQTPGLKGKALSKCIKSEMKNK